MQLSEALHLKKNSVCCSQCGYDLGTVENNWKDKASMSEEPMQNLGQPYSTDAKVLLRSFSCPGCGHLLDTETAMQGDPFLHDKLFINGNA